MCNRLDGLDRASAACQKEQMSSRFEVIPEGPQFALNVEKWLSLTEAVETEDLPVCCPISVAYAETYDCALCILYVFCLSLIPNSELKCILDIVVVRIHYLEKSLCRAAIFGH